MERIKKIKWMTGIGWLFVIYCLCVGFSFAAPYLGDFPEDQAIYYLWNSCDSDGASITRATDGTISIYKDNSDALTYDTTQVTHDVTDTEDFDSLTGVHMIVVGGTNSWFETGHDYVAVLSAASIDGHTVNAALFSWSYENRFDEVDVVEYKGNAVSATVNGIPDVNVTYWEDDAVPSTADGTPAANVEEWNDTDVPADVQAGYPTVTIKDGTGTGEIDTDSGTVLLRSATETQIDNIETDTAAQDTSTEIRTLMTGADTQVAKDSTPLTAAEIKTAMEAEGTSDLDAIADAVSSYLDAAVSGRAPASEYDTQMGYIPSDLGDVPTGSELDSQHGDGRWTTY